MRLWALFVLVGFSYLGMMLRDQTNPITSFAATANFLALIAVYFLLQKNIEGGAP